MNLFREYFTENSDQNDNSGTYASLNVSQESASELKNWCEENQIPFTVELDDVHCTIIYSRKAVDALSKWKIKLPVKVKITSWEILGRDETQSCLVGIIDDKRLQNLHNRICKDLGATHDFDEYKAHITISTNFSGSLPKSLPEFTIIFDRFTVEPLDLSK